MADCEADPEVEEPCEDIPVEENRPEDPPCGDPSDEEVPAEKNNYDEICLDHFRYCPDGHELTKTFENVYEERSGHTNFVCNHCRETKECFTGVLRCTDCDFDICSHCSNNGLPVEVRLHKCELTRCHESVYDEVDLFKCNSCT